MWKWAYAQWMNVYVGRCGAGVVSGLGALLLAVLLAPLVLGAAVAICAIAAVVAGIAALTGHRLGHSMARYLIGVGKLVAVAIPLGLLVAFFGHESPSAVSAGFYTALGAVPLSIALIVAGIYAEG